MVYSQCMAFTQKLANLQGIVHNEVKQREKKYSRLISNQDLPMGQGL